MVSVNDSASAHVHAAERARSAVAGRRWREACDRFAEARLSGDARSSGAENLAPADLEQMSMAHYLRGQHEFAFDLLVDAHELYRASGDRAGAARTAGWAALEHLEANDISQSLTWVAQAQRLIDQLDGAESIGARIALVPAALAPLFMGDIEDAESRFGSIADLADRSGDHELAALAALGRGMCLRALGRSPEGTELLARAAEAAVALDGSDALDVSPVATCSIYRVALGAFHEAFDLERARRWTAVFDRWCGEQPELVAYTGQQWAYRAELLLLRGGWSEASVAATVAEERLRAGDFTATFVANYQLAELHRLRGEFRRAEEHYGRAAETGWDPQPGLALLYQAESRYVDAQVSIGRALAGAGLGARGRLLPAAVEIEISAGHIAAARKAADALIELSQSAPTPMLRAVAETAQARVLFEEGRAPAAFTHAKAASSAWVALDAPYEVARCAVVRAQILRALGESEAANRSFEAARGVFLELGAVSDLSALAALTGRRVTGTLTDREIEVLRLVSTGLTNRAIAARLTLSEKTVARHLSNIFGKLELSSRAAATAYAYEHGLV